MPYLNINKCWLFSGIGGAKAPPYKNFKSFASGSRDVAYGDEQGNREQKSGVRIQKDKKQTEN
jgi:hypothetical protein